ncbi:peptidoglycan-binding protein [Jannaschia sp. W003]|uniref:peptidoglycan-binding protein n=1 Tax=Jannaschia sp. W003 TaxID=2867012 RepID=UPI0021A91F45|nr:peptidoglycan-binding protein [Jannaschia sp. W003]UWQ21098.1 peptidoglycan-binding protein [Jannaschia sp. W003]
MRIVSLLLALHLLAAGAASAQTAFVQIEAKPSLAEAESRARGYAGLFPNVNGFSLPGRWYGLALGPYPSPEAADAALDQFRAQNLIPRDSFVSDGGNFGERFWPAGVASAADAVATTPLPVPAAPAAPDAAPPEEDTRAALASEAALDGTAREALQRALRWFGFYDAAIDGSFGRGTRASMAAWQTARGLQPTGVLTTRQRAELLDDWRAAQAAVGLEPLEVPEAGVALTAPMGLVRFDRVEAPFVHYAPEDESGVRMVLISQAGDPASLGGLYEIMQTLTFVPPEGPRARDAGAFRIRGEAADRTTEVRAKLDGGHVVGFALSWPPERAAEAERAVEAMAASLRSTGAPLPSAPLPAGGTQGLDALAGLDVRRPLRSAAGFWVDRSGAVATAAATVEGCGRVTIEGGYDAAVAARAGGVAVLRPAAAIAPAEVARFAPEEGAARADVSVGGFPFGGMLGAATVSRGTLEAATDGAARLLRLPLGAEPGDAGGPVLDGEGTVAAMLLPKDPSRALPGGAALALPARAILPVLAEAGVSPEAAAPAGSLRPEALRERTAAITALVTCWE